MEILEPVFAISVRLRNKFSWFEAIIVSHVLQRP